MSEPEVSTLPPEKSTLVQLDGIDAVRRLVVLHGADRVIRWARLIAAQEGQEVNDDGN